MSRPDSLHDGWVCPNCHQVDARHGRGGARACKGSVGPRCEGLQCQCADGKCYRRGIGWTRSPCPAATCSHCGWTGPVQSKAFERHYGASRCPVSEHGWHDVKIRFPHNATPAGFVQTWICKLCGAQGPHHVDPVSGVAWTRKASGEDHDRST